MAKNILRSGKTIRPKTALKCERYFCAMCPQAKPKGKAPALYVVRVGSAVSNSSMAENSTGLTM
jgi:hypothetical protein